MIGDRCELCGLRRPSWHGGHHVCLKGRGVYRVGPLTKTITDFELEFLRADYAGLR